MAESKGGYFPSWVTLFWIVFLFVILTVVSFRVKMLRHALVKGDLAPIPPTTR